MDKSDKIIRIIFVVGIFIGIFGMGMLSGMLYTTNRFENSETLNNIKYNACVEGYIWSFVKTEREKYSCLRFVGKKG